MPVVDAIDPYQYFLVDRTHLHVLDVINERTYENGELSPKIEGLTQSKIDILQIAEEACRLFWQMPPRIRRRRTPSVSYAVTLGFLDGIWRDVLNKGSRVWVDAAWAVNSTGDVREKHIYLSFPSNYTGAIEKYVIRDDAFQDHGVTFISRTIQPACPFVFQGV